MSPIPAEVKTSSHIIPNMQDNPVEVACDFALDNREKPARTEQNVVVRHINHDRGKFSASYSLTTSTLTTLNNPHVHLVDERFIPSDLDTIQILKPLLEEHKVFTQPLESGDGLLVRVADLPSFKVNSKKVHDFFETPEKEWNPDSLGSTLAALMLLPESEAKKVEEKGLLLCTTYKGNAYEHHVQCLAIPGNKLLEWGIDLGSTVKPDEIYPFRDKHLSIMLSKGSITQAQLDTLRPVGMRLYYL